MRIEHGKGKLNTDDADKTDKTGYYDKIIRLYKPKIRVIRVIRVPKSSSFVQISAIRGL